MVIRKHDDDNVRVEIKYSEKEEREVEARDPKVG